MITGDSRIVFMSDGKPINKELITRLAAFTTSRIEQHKTNTDRGPIDLEGKPWNSEIDGAIATLSVPGSTTGKGLGTTPSENEGIPI
jgi:hypothetical protein